MQSPRTRSQFAPSTPLKPRKQRRSPRYTRPRKISRIPTPAPSTENGNKTRNTPVWFVQHKLGETPWEKQQEILNAVRDHRLVAVRSCNASGKTYAAALAAVWWLMTHDEAIVITTAPSDRQVKETIWREIRTIHSKNKHLIRGKITATRLELSNKRFAYGFSTNTAERFQGFHNENILIIVDEASGVREFIFDAIVGSMTSHNAKMLMIGNPTSLAGTFYDAFHKNRKHWKTIHISAFDTPNIKLDLQPGDNGYTPGLATRPWADDVLKQHGDTSSAYQVRVLGQFPDAADDTLISLKSIEEAINRSFDYGHDDEPVMGLDVARFGNDQTVAIVRRGPEVIQLAAHRKTDLMHTTGRAIEIAQSHGVKTIFVDDIGLGGGVTDRINELQKNREIRDLKAVGINGANKSDEPEKFPNLRTQMFHGLRQRFIDREISIPNDAELISQLASITYRYSSNNKLQIESKQQIRDAGRQSPDKADALALAFCAPNHQQRNNQLFAFPLTREGVEQYKQHMGFNQ
ncbi:MAG: hypothetical protein F4Y63_08545 [Chloroflexi bacterium]|nr:hypothetical protein [Chloroflexota bacterium]